VLAVYGSETWLVLEDLAQRHAAVARLKAGVIPNSGHNLHHDQPGAVASVTRAWLAESDRLPAGLTPA
jgi:pimeloyl-ACP methyl ester carboxylesterase